MAKFKQTPQTFLYKNLLKYWGNMVENFTDDCRDDDFFDVVRNITQTVIINTVSIIN